MDAIGWIAIGGTGVAALVAFRDLFVRMRLVEKRVSKVENTAADNRRRLLVADAVSVSTAMLPPDKPMRGDMH